MIEMVLSSCLAWVVVYPLGFIRFRYKPLNCELCLSGWIALVVCWHDWYTPLYMAGAMVTTVFITKQLNK